MRNDLWRWWYTITRNRSDDLNPENNPTAKATRKLLNLLIDFKVIREDLRF